MEQTCKNCKHFCQHYVHYYEQTYHACNCGHCVHPRIKPRNPDTPACTYFQPLDG